MKPRTALSPLSSKKISHLFTNTLCLLVILFGLGGCSGGSSGNPDPDPDKEILGEDASGGDISGGDTSGGDTSGGDTSGGDTSGGDTSGGDTSGGDTSGGDTSGGDTSGGDSSGGDTSGGDTSGGDTSGGDTSGGDTSGGDTTGGDGSEQNNLGTSTIFAPANFRVAVNQGLATFNWNEVGGAEKYTIYLADQSARSPDDPGIERLDNVVPPYSHAIQPGKTYFATMTVTIDGKESMHSAEIGLNISTPTFTGRLTRISVASDGGELPKSPGSKDAAISYYGRYVAFASASNNVIPDDNNNSWDVFVRDLQKGTTVRVSVDSNGAEGNGNSIQPSLSISGNGKFVVFRSAASNLVAGDTNGQDDIFIHDLDSRKTRRISVASDGTQGNDKSDYPVISFNGRFVAFRSASNNLVENDKNKQQDIFVRDLVNQKTSRISVDSAGREANNFSGTPAISANGRYVVFRSVASNLVPNDRNFSDPDIFIRDRATGTTSIVSVPSVSGQPAWGKNARNPAISSDGRHIAFQSDQKALVPDDENFTEDVLLRDRQAGTTTLLSISNTGQHGQGASGTPSISADGRFVVFRSTQKNLVPDDKNNKADIFLLDRASGKFTLISIADDGSQGNRWSDRPVISGNGRYILFESLSSNLVPADNNGSRDIFIYDTLATTP